MKLAILSLLTSTASANLFAPQALHNKQTRRLEDDMSWMNGYTVLYENCFHSDNVVTFKLCPEGNRCEAGCEGSGEYVADLNFFVDAFSEAQMGAREYKCEMVRENCDYDDDALCYSEAGYEDCADMNEDEDGFNVQEWMECNQLDDNYYVGPYCAEDNYNIYLGLFTNAACTQFADAESTDFYDTYGYVMPYTVETGTPIISSECADCREHGAEEDQNGGDDAEDEDDVIEQCEELYNEASKCESNLDVEYPDVSSCSYISQLQKDESVTPGAAKSEQSGPGKWVYFLSGFSILACCCGGFLFKKRQDQETKLSDPKQTGLMA